jgi:hypothetical protein
VTFTTLTDRSVTTLPERTRETTPEQARLDANALAEEGWRVAILPPGLHDGESFLAALRQLIPLDPPINSFKKQDALSDSISGGLYTMGPGPVAIVWPEPETMRRDSPNDFATAVDLLGWSTMIGGTSGAPTQVLFILGGEHPLGPTRPFRSVNDVA